MMRTTCVNELKNQGYKIISIEQTEESKNLDEVSFNSNEKLAVILGNEVKGVQQKLIDLSDYSIELPQYGTKHSLNISVCAGIVIWEVRKAFIKDHL